LESLERLVVAALTLTLLSGCGTSAAALRPSAVTSTSPSPSISPTPSPVEAPTPTPTATASISASPPAQASAGASPSCLDRTLSTLTEDQRIGQLFLLGLASNQLGAAEASEIQADHVGSVWFTERAYSGAAAVRATAAAVQAQASAASTGGVRFFVAANQEGGLVQALQGAGFSLIPSALVQGGWTAPTLTGRAAAWGTELRNAGVNLDFAPVADVVPPGFDSQNQPIGALQREYGHDPVTAGSHAAAFLLGLRQAGVAVTLKHFPGLGRVTGNTDFTAATDSVTTVDDPYLQSFAYGVGSGADMVMVAIATYTRIDPSHLAAFSPVLIERVLRGSMAFKGVVVSDDLGATAAVANIPYGERALAFLEAGGDLVTSKTAAATHSMVLAVRARAASDPAFRARVDDAARSVLQAKQAHGLLPC
jgi:beta-N-acetylhexosaminidase